MSDYYNEFSQSTTYIKPVNLQIVADIFKNVALNTEYATCYGWYNELTEAKTYNEVFDIFGITFKYDEGKLYPVVNNVYTHSIFKNALKAIAPYMEDGSIYVKDSEYFTTLTFTNGKITGSRRKLEYGQPIVSSVKVEAKAPSNVKKPKKSGKITEFSKIKVRTDIDSPATIVKADNTYTVQELVKELLRQMDKGNASKTIEVKADFLFK